MAQASPLSGSRATGLVHGLCRHAALLKPGPFDTHNPVCPPLRSPAPYFLKKAMALLR